MSGRRPSPRDAPPQPAGGRPVALVRAVGAGCVPAAALLTALVVTAWEPLVDVDRAVTRWWLRLLADRPDVVEAVSWVTHGLGPWPVRGLVLVVAGLLAVRGRGRAAAWALAASWGGGLVVLVTKALVERARPDPADPLATADGTSYPSGHALGATVGSAVLVLLAWPHLSRAGRAAAAAAGVVVAVAVSASRVALGVHFLSDVVGGALLGLVWLAVVTVALRPALVPTGSPGPPPAPAADPPDG